MPIACAYGRDPGHETTPQQQTTAVEIGLHFNTDPSTIVHLCTVLMCPRQVESMFCLEAARKREDSDILAIRRQIPDQPRALRFGRPIFRGFVIVSMLPVLRVHMTQDDQYSKSV